MTDSDSDGGSYTSDSLKRSGSTGTTSTIKPIKEGYLTKKGALVSKIQLTYKSFKSWSDTCPVTFRFFPAKAWPGHLTLSPCMFFKL